MDVVADLFLLLEICVHNALAVQVLQQRVDDLNRVKSNYNRGENAVILVASKDDNVPARVVEDSLEDQFPIIHRSEEARQEHVVFTGGK